MAEDPKYNWIYKALVKGPDDVSGALAYGLYKADKIAYIESFAKEKGHQPDTSELAEFHRMTNLPGALDTYRERADALLETFLDNMLTEQLDTYRTQVRDDAMVKAMTRGFWPGVWQNVVAGLFATLMTFGFVLAVWMYNEGPSKILSGAANKFLGTDAAASPAQTAKTTKDQ
jgi:hypothetical protein